MNHYAQSHIVASNPNDAVKQAAANLKQAMHDNPIDLMIAFAAGYSASQLDEVFPQLKSLTGADAVIGCSCVTAIGGGVELENESAITLWAAHFPAGNVVPMYLSYERTPDGGAFVGWPSDAGGSSDSNAAEQTDDDFMILLGEPFGFPVDVLLEQMNDDRPGYKIVGGMASGAHQPGEARLLFGDEIKDSGAVAVRITDVPVATIVSQGCRPIGEPRVITAAERNIIQQLGGLPALAVLQTFFDELPTRDQRLVQNGLHVGRVISEYQDKFEFGDFLIRNVIGIDGDAESISIGDYVRPGQTVQFHVRDAESASAELSQMLVKSIAASGSGALGGLIFTCNGRGLNLFPDPNHDAAMVQAKAGAIPVAGFFAAGEIGPVGEKNFLHGFTASVILFG